MGREARASQAAANVSAIEAFVLSMPFAKVDKDKRLVTGVATAENIDKQGEIVDYATAKKFFLDDTLWPGNIREMHKAEAVGTAVDVECDDANKVISITARISKGAPNTWEKVLDGTLKMFSIGGSGKRAIEKTDDGKTVKRLFLEQLAEVSVVDNGANPLAKFDIVKSVDGAVVRIDVDTGAEIADPNAVDPIQKATAAVDAAAAASAPPAPVAAPVAVVVEAGGIRKLLAALATAGTDRIAQKADIIAKAVAAGPELVLELPKAWQPDAVEKGGPEYYDIDRALAAISMLESLLSSEYYDAMFSQPTGTPPDPVKVAQVAAIKAAIDAVLQFLVSEHEQQFAPNADGSGGLGVDVIVEMFVKSLDVVQKAGARHSKSDVEMIQKVHDLSGTLGAACYTDTEKLVAAVITAGYDVKKVDAPAPAVPAATDAASGVTKATELSTDIQKLAADLETTKAALTESQATMADQAKTAAALEARLKTLEDSPAAGGPVRSAAAVVDKALGGPSETDQASTESVIKALQDIAKDGDDIVRAAATKHIVKVQQENPIQIGR